jgi:hypothetical protein
VRYVFRHGDGRVTSAALLAPSMPILRRTADNPDGLDPPVIAAGAGR